MGGGCEEMGVEFETISGEWMDGWVGGWEVSSVTVAVP